MPPPRRIPEEGEPDETFIDLYVAGVARADDRPQPARRRRIQPAGRPARARPAGHRRRGTGRYSFKGSGYVRGGIFDRIELIQDEQQHPFPRPQPYAAGRPCRRRGAGRFREIALFVHPAGVRLRSDRALAAATAGAARGRCTRTRPCSRSISATRCRSSYIKREPAPPVRQQAADAAPPSRRPRCRRRRRSRTRDGLRG